MTADTLLKSPALDISVDASYYNSDAIEHGRLVKNFFTALAQQTFKKAHLHWQTYQEYGGHVDIPLLYGERNLYSLFAAAIDELTPVHLSEWSFNLPEDFDANKRVVDFWCMHRASPTGRALNYFIELKKTHYSVSSGTREQMAGAAKKVISEAIDQVSVLKALKPDWLGSGEVFLALPVIHGYHAANRSAAYTEAHLLKELSDLIDRRWGAQLISSTWTLPDDMEVQWESDKCRFIMIAGIAITKKRS